MSQFDPALTRSAVVFGAFFLILAVGLHVLYQTPTFEEGTEPGLLLGLFLATGAALWLGRSGAHAMTGIVVAPIRRFGLRAVAGFILIMLILFLLVARVVLDAFPNSGDEMAYVLQAQTYAQGRLWVDPPPLVQAFRQIRFFNVSDKWVSQYAPGWAMVLAPAAAVGVPLWIVNPFIGAATLVAFFGLSRHYVRVESAWIGMLILGVSSFYILNSGSYFSHNLTAFYGVVFALFGLRYLKRGEIWCAVAAGASIGLMGLTRAQSAVIFAMPFAVALAMTPGRRVGLMWFGLGGAPFLVALLAYNDAITGHPLAGVSEYYRSEPLGRPSMSSLRLTLRLFERLFIWTSPALLFGFFLAFFSVLRRRRADFCDWIMPLTILLYLLYGGDGGNQYGPRYYFEGWPFAVLTILKVIDPILFDAECGARAAWVSSALIVSLMMEIGYLPARFEREHRVVMERQEVYEQVAQADLDKAIVIISSDVGVIRPMVPRDLVRNGLHVDDQRVIYALDGAVAITSLRLRFPRRSVYVYSNGKLLEHKFKGRAMPDD